MSDSNIHFMLKALSCMKTELVCLDYKDYRRRFSVTAVPVVRKVPNLSGDGVSQVYVNREKAMDFLRRRHEFLTRPELITTLKEVSEDFQETVKRTSF